MPPGAERAMSSSLLSFASWFRQNKLGCSREIGHLVGERFWGCLRLAAFVSLSLSLSFRPGVPDTWCICSSGEPERPEWDTEMRGIGCWLPPLGCVASRGSDIFPSPCLCNTALKAARIQDQTCVEGERVGIFLFSWFTYSWMVSGICSEMVWSLLQWTPERGSRVSHYHTWDIIATLEFWDGSKCCLGPLLLEPESQHNVLLQSGTGALPPLRGLSPWLQPPAASIVLMWPTWHLLSCGISYFAIFVNYVILSSLKIL